MTPNSHVGAGQGAQLRLRPPALAALGLVMLLAALSACQGEARTKVDCDQLLNEGKYSDVVKKCDDPYQLSSAYLGLGGFDIFGLVNSTSANGKVAVLLGLTAANIDTKRGYFNKALEVVNPPHGGSQAFALLVASFLGLGVTTDQFLDNGVTNPVGPVIDPAQVLDDSITTTEIAGAVGVPTGTGIPTLTVLDSVNHYAVRYGGKSYVIDCTTAATPCGSDNTALVYDDPNGTGILNTTPGESADKSTVLAGVASFTSAGRVVQLETADISLALPAATYEPTTSYLGRSAAPVTFDVGLSTYLTGLNRANAELLAATGSSGGSDLTAQVDAITTQLDNGGTCGGSTVFADQLGLLYLAASGTTSKPAPSNGDYGTTNLLATAAVPDLTIPAYLLPGIGFPAITAGNQAFTVSYYKLIFSTQAAMGAYDLTKATPRVDAAYSPFPTTFENIWLFSPGASPMGDNGVNVAEILCSAG